MIEYFSNCAKTVQPHEKSGLRIQQNCYIFNERSDLPLEAPDVSDLQEVRRANLRKIVERENATKVAKKLGYRSPSFLSQMIGPNPSRDITEKNARRYEQDLGLEPGALDVGEVTAPPAPPPMPSMDVQVISDVVRMVGSICAGENVSLGPEKFSELIALALVDSVEHGGKPREQQIRSVVRLLK